MDEIDSQNRIPELKSDLTDEGQADILRMAFDLIEQPNTNLEDVDLSDEEFDRLLRYSKEGGPSVRRLAVEFLVLLSTHDLGWDDLVAWTLDPDRAVRQQAIEDVDTCSGPLWRLCLSDRPHCAKILARSVERYDEGELDLMLLVTDSNEWLEAIWPEIGPMLDLARPDLWSRLTIGFIEDVLRDRGWGPDDKHLRDWIEGDKVQRKMSLLAVARWFQLGRSNLRDITETLARDPDPVIAHIAKAILTDHSGRFELKLEDYEKVREWLEGQGSGKTSS